MMTRRSRDEWSAALRSDEYNQGRSMLCTGEKFCCLGVRCQLDVKAGLLTRVNATRVNAPDRQSANVVAFADSSGIMMIAVPTPEVCEQWGLPEDDVDTLVTMNDSGKSFLEIADYLDSLEVIDD